MKGKCEDCAKRDGCIKMFGMIAGYCNTDFVPAKEPEKQSEGDDDERVSV